jgi:hypothetical protein
VRGDGTVGALDTTVEASHHHVAQALQMSPESSLQQHAVLPANGTSMVQVIHGNPA